VNVIVIGGGYGWVQDDNIIKMKEWNEQRQGLEFRVILPRSSASVQTRLPLLIKKLSSR
jgi:hypothetical protein